MGTDDTDGHGQSLEPGATDARLRGGFVPQKTAFVFAGGGSLGAVQVGMLRELTRRGVSADFVVGSSVGAINARVILQARPTQRGSRNWKRFGAHYGDMTCFPSLCEASSDCLAVPTI